MANRVGSKAIRKCCCCEVVVKAIRGPRKTSTPPYLVTIIPMVYRRAEGKRSLKYAANVSICEECLEKTHLPWMTEEAMKFAMALLASIEARYNDTVREDAA